ncbi:MAG: hypothetical protein KGQ28_05360, partial [Hyphomicrobiales bacterium]|nr:hypothetical protein [Hyphomicrobiales bacterium]
MRSLAPDVTRLALAALMATDGGRAFGAPSPAIPPPTAAAIGLRGVASAVVADLQLAVTVNGRPTGLIAAFMRAPDGALSASRGDLAEIGLRAPGSGPPDALVPLASLAGVTWTYDASTQTIRF